MPATLSRSEKKVLIGLCKYIINSDGIITEEEISKLNQIALEIGMDDYEEVFNEVDSEITSMDDLESRIDDLKESTNLKKILGYTIQMSRVDGNITADEIDILVYAADAWNIDLKSLMKKC